MSINRGAQIMVMTTEVYRNMAWRAIDEEIEESEDNMLDDVISSKGRSELSNLACVVLDEFHCKLPADIYNRLFLRLPNK